MDDHKIAVSVKNLSKNFGDLQVLQDVTLDIYKGETFLILGGSGSGKSTLLRIMTGGIKPTSGEIFFGDKDVSTLSADELDKLKRRFGMSFQSSALLDFLSVEENVSLFDISDF